MKVAILVARILEGLVFFAAGVVGILHLGKLPAATDDGTLFLTLLTNHGFSTFVALLMLIGGLLLLVGRFVLLGLTILGPVLVNILLFHMLFHYKGIISGLVLTVVEIFLLWAYRFSFRGLFDASPEVS